ncbi:hypothetical protein [Nocardia paucivorans]|uniref:hypothetical protein n=1 Tax=Nocardia paucivorans TaxID=114259 RepID=UPI0002E98913|nr:hypothetical protein [Nocardia paucivorans]
MDSYKQLNLYKPLNPGGLLARAMKNVAQQLAGLAKESSKHGFGLESLASKTAAAPKTLILAEQNARKTMSAVDLLPTGRTSNGSVFDRDLPTRTDRAPRTAKPSALVAKVPDLHGHTLERAEAEMSRSGFTFKSETAGGYRRYRAKDKSEIWIRPNGEVQRFGPKVSPGPNQKSYRPRYLPGGTETQEHSTGEMVIR